MGSSCEGKKLTQPPGPRDPKPIVLSALGNIISQRQNWNWLSMHTCRLRQAGSSGWDPRAFTVTLPGTASQARQCAQRQYRPKLRTWALVAWFLGS